MANFNVDIIFLGTVADIDVSNDTGNGAPDSIAPLNGVTYGSLGNPLGQNLVDAAFSDANDDGNMDADNESGVAGSGETVSYDLGSGNVSSNIDGVYTVSGTVNSVDGTSKTIDEAYVFQMENGDLFLYNSNWSGSTDLTSATGSVIEFVTLDWKSGANWTDIANSEMESFVCFTRGTLIMTHSGEVPVENLSIGDMVRTMDAGYQSIRWIGKRKFDAVDLAANPKLRPVRIHAGALGNRLPETDLTVSRQHRVLVISVIAERMFGTHEVLVPAIKLVELDGIDVDNDTEDLEYFHFLFDAHQIIWSNGAPTESLFTGPEALKAVSSEARDEIIAIFPEITQPDFHPMVSRLIPDTGKKVKQLVARHFKNDKPLIQVTYPEGRRFKSYPRNQQTLNINSTLRATFGWFFALRIYLCPQGSHQKLDPFHYGRNVIAPVTSRGLRGANWIKYWLAEFAIWPLFHGSATSITRDCKRGPTDSDVEFDTLG